MEDDEFLASCLPGSACHEAGHVVVDLHYGVRPNFATVEPTEEFLARVNTPRMPYTLLGSLEGSPNNVDWLIRQ